MSKQNVNEAPPDATEKMFSGTYGEMKPLVFNSENGRNSEGDFNTAVGTFATEDNAGDAGNAVSAGNVSNVSNMSNLDAYATRQIYSSDISITDATTKKGSEKFGR